MKLVISASPHIDSGATTRKIMGDVLIALLPALIAAVIIFGWRALLVTAVCAAACVFFEWGFEKLCHKPSTIDDLSAVVTGLNKNGIEFKLDAVDFLRLPSPQ